ncbi:MULTISPECIES: RNA-binding cell elongation regulator Jag/EloR [unclassified Bacillus (in: firmicutes)]|uniref:RNA-binding cell elongation regulator Jag/EloR n=1 Tax=unclassified Bacillus (in: firmicutes) TaxID=185979 RepID=UPI0006B03F9D|nr:MULTISPECIES: RNA-binding cell elongation regulator Jag/EloR [unclassified Bacillus (in: firmicutes)]ALC87144.1 protein jag [Bacillus sp. FJAT-22090]MDF2067510.1 protein jag [Bacillus sp. Cr_A10]
MNQITQTAPTKEEAITVALQKLGVSKQEVTITVLDEGKKGFLGFGAKPAVVQVTVRINEEKVEEVHEPEVETLEVNDETEISPSTSNEVDNLEGTNHLAIEETINYINEIAKEMKIDDLEINQTKEGKFVYLQLNSKKAALLIGKRGQTLNALESLAQLVANKFSNSFIIIKLDVGNYREKRQESLEQLAERMADKAVRTGNKVEFEPMTSFERKIIHNALSVRVDIETYSVGTDPNRYLVIEPIK